MTALLTHIFKKRDSNVAPDLSEDAAQMLYLKDLSPQDGFTFEDYQGLFPKKRVDAFSLQESYSKIVSYSEDGVITKRSAMRFLAEFDPVYENKLYWEIYWERFFENASSLVSNFGPRMANFYTACASESYDVVSDMPPSFSRAVSHAFFFISAMNGKLVNGVGSVAGLYNSSMEIQDPGIDADASFAVLTLGLSFLLKFKSLGGAGKASGEDFISVPSTVVSVATAGGVKIGETFLDGTKLAASDFVMASISSSGNSSSIPPWRRKKSGNDAAYTDEELAEMLRRAKGDRKIVTAKTGYGPSTLEQRITRPIKKTPLDEFRMPGRGKYRVSARDLKKVLTETGGNVEKASALLNKGRKRHTIRARAIYNRIRRDEALAKFRKPKRTTKTLQTVSTSNLHAILQETGNSLTETARVLKERFNVDVHPSTILRRVQKDPGLKEFNVSRTK